MMKGIELVQNENIDLLKEIANLKTTVNEICNKKGPGNPDYIDLTIKLDLLMKEYIEEKIENLI